MADPQQTYERFQKTLSNVQQAQGQLKNYAGELIEQATEIAATVMPRDQIHQTVDQVASRVSPTGGSNFSGERWGNSSSGRV